MPADSCSCRFKPPRGNWFLKSRRRRQQLLLTGLFVRSVNALRLSEVNMFGGDFPAHKAHTTSICTLLKRKHRHQLCSLQLPAAQTAVCLSPVSNFLNLDADKMSELFEGTLSYRAVFRSSRCPAVNLKPAAVCTVCSCSTPPCGAALLRDHHSGATLS